MRDLVGGALAIGLGNKVYMLENAIYSILSPEGFASILWKDSKRAKEAAEKMKLTSQDLLNFGVIDGVIDEPVSQEYNEEFVKELALRVREQIVKDTELLKRMDRNEVIEDRYNKFRKIGC